MSGGVSIIQNLFGLLLKQKKEKKGSYLLLLVGRIYMMIGGQIEDHGKIIFLSLTHTRNINGIKKYGH